MTRALLLLLALGVPAAAHERTVSYSTWEVDGRRARVTVRVAALDVSRFPWATAPGYERMLATYLAEHLTLRAGDDPCPRVGEPRPLAAVAGRLAYEWDVACSATGALHVRSDLFVDVAPTHLHFARLARGPEYVLSASERTWAVGATRVQAPPTSYFRLGVEHIVGGYDHLAFLLALLLLGGSIGEVARIVTGFTAAHSVTLALAVLGYVRPEAAPVEALIGLSIALVATENVWLRSGQGRTLPALIGAALLVLAAAAAVGAGNVPALTLGGLALFSLCYFALLGRVERPAALRASVAFVFGLVHGFGFARVLAEAGLEGGHLVPALLGFNLGVEAGQLAVVALLWPVLQLAVQRRPAILDLGSATVAGLGLFWFVSRGYG